MNKIKKIFELIMSLNTCLDISEIKNLINNKSFNEIKIIMNENNIKIRELDSIYLLISDNNDNILSNSCNGIILEKETNNVVCVSQNKFYKIERNNLLDSDIDLQINHIYNLQKNSTKMRVEYCEDATRICLYNYKGIWYTSTTKCIDAKSSYWNSKKSFDELFWQVFDNDFINTIDPEFTYTFLLLHKENRIVVKHQFNNLIYINRVNNNTLIEDYTNYFYKEGPKRTIRRPKEIDSKLNYPLDNYFLPNKRGIIIKFLVNNSWVSHQYDFNDYSNIKQLRGNTPDIKMRYLELLNEPESLILLEKYYPEHLMIYAMIKHQMKNLYESIHITYFNSHVRHSLTIEEDDLYFKTCKQLHYQYKTLNEPITLEKVKLLVNNLDKYILKNFLGWIN
jgi:hypothetical protein